GDAITLSVTGMSSGPAITYQWQSSTDGTSWTDITDGSTSNLAVAAEAGLVSYRLRTTCSDSGDIAYSNTVTHTAVACGSVNLPSTGAGATVYCGSSTKIYDNGGPSGSYSSSSNGYIVLENSGTGVITITGTYNTESG